MSRHYTSIIQCSQVKPQYKRKMPGRRVYLLVENRGATNAIMDYDSLPAQDASGGILLPAGQRYEVWEPFAPDNEVLWFQGTNGSTLQTLNITEGYVDKAESSYEGAR
jgi:hypothetical protein